MPFLGNLLGGRDERGNIQNKIAAIGVRWHADGIAPALISNRRHIDRRATVPADDVLSVLAIAFCATNPASVQSRAVTIRLLDNQEAHRLMAGSDVVEMQTSILNFT